MKINKQTVFQVLILILSLLNLLYMHYSVLVDRYSLTNFSYVENICHAIADICFIYCIFFLLIKKKSYLFFIPYALLTLFIITNIWYSRYFYTYMPPTLYTEFNNLDGLSANVIAAMKPSDIFLVITTTIGIIYYYRYHSFFSGISRNKRIKLSGFFLGLGLIIIICMVGISKINWPKLEYKYVHPFKNSPSESTFKFGIIYSSIIQVILSNKQSYTEEELAALKPFFYGIANPVENHPQNVIFILVESLLSYPTNMNINGVEITPTLNQLVKEGAYYNANMESQVQLGESSDGQFTYLNGLLPKKRGVTIIDYFNNTFLSLPKLLKEQNQNLHSRMIIPTSSKTWRQDGICMQYGFDSLYSRKEYDQEDYTESWLTDKRLFEYAANIDQKSKQPFFSMILTSSTHSPYTRNYEKNNIPFPSEYSNELKNYLSNVHYMDKYLGAYICFLKEKKLYDNTMIIITSDHTISNDWLNLNDIKISSKIPLYIINSPKKIEKGTNYSISQIDLFPTILDLMGIKSQWRGVGNSLLIPDSILGNRDQKIRKEKTQEVSDIILNSNYFKQKK